MPRILVVYGTTDGHTARVAEAIGRTLRDEGVTAIVDEANRTTHVADDFDATIVTASVHAGRFQDAVERWVRQNHRALNARPGAFVSVCLGVLQHDPKVDRDLQRMIERFTTSTSWRPTTTKIVAGALLYTQYGWLKRMAMLWIASRAGGATDTSRDYIYTDWSDLSAFVTRFAHDHVPRATAGESPAVPTRVAS
jgi:menaquinone-dependent protoporphyrinogen oxidase